MAADKLSVSLFEAFQSPNLAPLAEIGAEIRLHPEAGQFERRVPAGLGAAWTWRYTPSRPIRACPGTWRQLVPRPC